MDQQSQYTKVSHDALSGLLYVRKRNHGKRWSDNLLQINKDDAHDDSEGSFAAASSETVLRSMAENLSSAPHTFGAAMLHERAQSTDLDDVLRESVRESLQKIGMHRDAMKARLDAVGISCG